MADFLFSNGRLSDVLDARVRDMHEAIANLPGDTVLTRSLDDVATEVADDFSLEPLTVNWDRVEAEQKEVRIDVSQDWDRVITDRSRPFYLSGTRVTYVVPFSGVPGLLGLQPSTFTMNPPRGTIHNQELRMTWEGVDATAEVVRSAMDRAQESIQQYVEWIRGDVSSFNAGLLEAARKAVQNRYQKVRADADLVAQLGVPIRQDVPTAKTYAAPQIQRRSTPQARRSGKPAERLEPTMLQEDYELVIEVSQRTGIMFERSPAAFAHMEEEHVRDQFLVQLNGHFSGGVTGETFNANGKTDILIRSEGRTVFIAECKFWDGAGSLTAAIDQILGYLTWRDTKAAIFLFNRDRKLSTILTAVPATVKAHPSYVRDLGYDPENGSRYVLRQKRDPDRLITLTILVFDVPGGPPKKPKN